MRAFSFIVFAALFIAIALSCSVVSAVPEGFMTFFDRVDCPTGWEEFTASRGRMIVSVTNATNAGITVGTPLKDREDRSHTHRTSLAGKLPEQHIAGAGGGNREGAQNGAVSTRVPSDGESSGLPFTQLKLCRVSRAGASADPVAIGTIAFFDPSVNACPSAQATANDKASSSNKAADSWVPMHSVEGRIVVPGFNEGGGMPNKAAPLASGEDRQHTHTNCVVPVQEKSVSYVGIDGCCNGSPSRYEKDLTMSGEAESASSGLPFMQLLTCSSEATTFNLTLPSGALIFNEENCPPGWSLALEPAGRVLVSLPSGGQPGAFFGGESFSPSSPTDPTHKHYINGTVNFPSTGIELGSGCCAGGYAGSGSFPVEGFTTPSDVDLPLTLFPMCRQNSDAKHITSQSSPLSQLFARNQKRNRRN